MKTLFLLSSIFIAYISPSEVQAKIDDVPFHFFVQPIAGPEEVVFEIMLTNEGQKTLEFEIPSSQFYEITIQDHKDEVVYRYSEGRYFLQAIQKVIIKPGETKTWMETWDYYRNKKRIETWKIQSECTI